MCSDPGVEDLGNVGLTAIPHASGRGILNDWGDIIGDSKIFNDSTRVIAIVFSREGHHDDSAKGSDLRGWWCIVRFGHHATTCIRSREIGTLCIQPGGIAGHSGGARRCSILKIIGNDRWCDIGDNRDGLHEGGHVTQVIVGDPLSRDGTTSARWYGSGLCVCDGQRGIFISTIIRSLYRSRWRKITGTTQGDILW